MSYIFNFDINHPEFKRQGFEEDFAKALLKALNEAPCYPQAVPFINDEKTTRQIGSANNFWLKNLGDGSYEVVARYSDEFYKAKLGQAKRDIRRIYEMCLLPERAGAPTDSPLLPRTPER